jgi:hypothetical protein
MSWLNIFKKPDKGKAKIEFIAINEDGEYYEEVAFIPYEGKYDELVIMTKFKKYFSIFKKEHELAFAKIVERIEDEDD